MPAVALLGALDTKGAEASFVRQVLIDAGVDVVVVDVGVLGEPAIPADVSREAVARRADQRLEQLAQQRDRGAAVTAMAAGARGVVEELYASGRISAGIALGGTAGTTIASAALTVLPLGVPKAIVSTAASGNTYSYVRETDLVLFPSVVDIAGLNRISRPILRNAARAVAGMVLGIESTAPTAEGDRPLIAASMFGVTTASVERARARLESAGFEVLVFHMTGTGGRAMESLIRQGLIAGVLDTTTTELADELVGGVFSAGPERLTAAATGGIPQVVSVGALDMVNFGEYDSVPSEHRDRVLYRHNANTTLMRVTADEAETLGQRLASRVSGATGPTAVFLPLRGVSAIDVSGQPFFDEDADARLFAAVRDGLTGSAVELVEIDCAINDPAFADAMADRLIEFLEPSLVG